MIVTIDVPGERIIIDAEKQSVKCVSIDGGGHPIGTVREGTIAKLLAEICAIRPDAARASSGSTGAQSLAQPTPEDTKRLDHLEAWLDGFEFVHLPTQIEPEVRCDWFAGDGSGHWFTQGKTFREAIDKSLNHEATQESHD